MDVTIAMLRGKRLAVLTSFVEVTPHQQNLSAEISHRLHLDGIRLLGGADSSAYAKQPSRKGDGLTVVAGRGRDDTAGAGCVVELGQQVDTAAYLESPGGQQIVVLHPELGAHQP